MSNRRKSRRTPLRDEYRRARLVQNLLSVGCLACHAPVGTTCAPLGQVHMLDRHRALFAHDSRILMACASGRADAHQVIAQFDVLPDELAALADF